MCFVWIWEQTAIISLYSINWLVCITETECLLRGTDWSLHIIQLYAVPQLHRCTLRRSCLVKMAQTSFYDLLRQLTTSKIFKERKFVSGFWKMKGREWPGLEIAGFWEWNAWLLANNGYTSRVGCCWMHEWCIDLTHVQSIAYQIGHRRQRSVGVS